MSLFRDRLGVLVETESSSERGLTVTLPVADTRSGTGIRGLRTRRWLLDNTVWILLVVALAGFSIGVSGYFSRPIYINIVYHAVPLGLLALGEALVILTGNIDLSIEPVATLAALLSSWLSAETTYAAGYHLNPALSLLAAVGAGIAVGALNATIILKFGVNSFLATLGTYIGVRGIADTLTSGTGVSLLPSSFTFVDTFHLFGVPLMTYLMLAIFVAFYFILTKTQFGRHLYVIGGNRQAAYGFGVRVDRVIFRAYVLCGALAALAGFLLAARTNGATPDSAKEYLFDALAAVVIGGVSLVGGYGTLAGVLGGVLLLSTVQTALDLMAISPFAVDIVRGGLVLFAVIFDAAKRKITV